MKLLTVHIKEFRSIWDSNSFSVGKVTCLVGKNEAGKTAVLHALYRLNPTASVRPDVDVLAKYTTARKNGDQHDYQLEICLRNNGDSRIGKYQVELEFPAIFLSLTNTFYSLELRERRTRTHRTFRVTEMEHQGMVIFPGDLKRIFTLDYSINQSIYDDPDAMKETFTVRTRVENQPSQETVFKIEKFQNF